MHVCFFTKPNMAVFIFCFIVMTYVLPSVFTLPFTLSFRNFETKIGTRSRLLHCQFFIPQFSQCGIRSQWQGYFVSDVFLFFLPEIYLETGMDTGCMTAQWKSLMLPFLLPLFITLKQHRFVCSHSAYVGVGFSNIPILDVLLARCWFFFLIKMSQIVGADMISLTY